MTLSLLVSYRLLPGSIMSVTGLEEGRTYTLYLAAANAAGFGDVAKIRVRTQREIPAEQPGAYYYRITTVIMHNMVLYTS